MTATDPKPSAIPIPTSKQVLAWTTLAALASIVLQMIVGA